ncbi:DegV family protein, partial [Staphylococcus epidermidis]|uniref:DegV family protein n=1 Tax=Staphylococcus epidermidis TaxID=1282 RepID=UPI0021B2D567
MDGKSYTHQLHISSTEYIHHIQNDPHLKTTQPPIPPFIQTYHQLPQHHLQIITIHLSSPLTPTYNTPLQPTHILHPNITLIHSKSISFPLRYQINQILELITRA